MRHTGLLITLIIGVLIGLAAAGLFAIAEPVPEPDHRVEMPSRSADDARRLAELDAIQQAKAEADRAVMAPVPPDLRQTVWQASREFEIPLPIAVSLGTQETGWDCSLIGEAGEIGCYQVKPETAQEMAAKLGLTTYDLTDPATGIRLGAAYLRQCYDQEGSWYRALSRYNGGNGWQNIPTSWRYAGVVLGRAIQR